MLTLPDRDDARVGTAGDLRGVRHRLLDGQRADHQRRGQRHAAGPGGRGVGGDVDQQADRREYRCGAVRFGRRCGAGADTGADFATAARPLWFVCIALGLVVIALGLVSTSPRALGPPSGSRRSSHGIPVNREGIHVA